MADQNQSNKRGMNTVADDIDMSPHLTELERIGARAIRRGVNRSQLEDRIRSEGKMLNDLLQQGRANPVITEGPFYGEQVSSLRQNIKNLRTRMNSIDSAATTRAESEASTYLGRQFSSQAINSQVSVMQRESMTQNRAFSLSGQTYDQLEQQRQDILGNIRLRERNVLNEVKGMYDEKGRVIPEKSAALGVMFGGAQTEMQQLATINAAQAIQRYSGKDPNSQLRRMNDVGQKAENILSSEAIARELSSGSVSISSGGKQQTVQNQDIDKEIVNQARLLKEALENLAKTSADATEDLEKFRKQADEATDNFEKLERAQAAGGGGSRFGGTISTLNNIGAGFNVAGQAMQSLLIDQRFGQVNNTAGFAGIANSQYDLYKKARSGDIASQMALGQTGEAENFATEMNRATDVVKGAYAAGAAAQTAAGALSTAEAAGQKANPLAYASGASTQNTKALQEGILNTAQGAAGLAVIGGDSLKQISANQNAIAGYNAQMQARMAINAVGAEQAQGLRDMYVGLGVAGQSLGSRASGFIDTASTDATLNRMIDSRMSPEQFNKMAQFGAAEMGSTFNMDQIFASRNLERGGFGNMQQNMGRMSTLANAGSNNPQAGLQSVLEAAFTKGLDSSKAIDMMVQNTAAMVQQSGTSMAAGIDTTGAVSTMLAGNVDSSIANKEFAIQRAAAAQDVMNQVTTDTSVSYTGMINTARISEATGLAGDDALFAAKLTPADIKALQQQDSNKAKKALLNRGVNVKGDISSFLSKMLQVQTAQMFTGAGALAFGSNEDREGLIAAATAGKSFESLSDDQQALLGKMGGTKNLVGKEYFNAAAGITNASNAQTNAKDVMAGKGPETSFSKADDLRTSGFKQLSEAAKSASDGLGGFTKAIETFMNLQKSLEKDGVKKEGEFRDAGAKMAEDFKINVVNPFGEHVKAFGGFVKDAKELRSNRLPIVPESATDLLDKVKGSN